MGDNIPVVFQSCTVTCGHRSTSRTVQGPPDENKVTGGREKETEKLLVDTVKQELLIAADATKTNKKGKERSPRSAPEQPGSVTCVTFSVSSLFPH